MYYGTTGVTLNREQLGEVLGTFWDLFSWSNKWTDQLLVAAMELPIYQSHHPLHLEVSKVLQTFLLVKQAKRPAISGYQGAFISLKTK